MSNKNHTVLYTGVTTDLVKRVGQHKEHLFNGFSNKYNTELLMYYEFYASIEQAIEKEKIVKGGSRKKKLALIKSVNPEGRDLYDQIRGL